MATVKLKRSSVVGKVPTTAQLTQGELALNTEDGHLYAENNAGTQVLRIGTTSDRVTVTSDGQSLDNFLKNKNAVVVPSIAGLAALDPTKFTYAYVQSYHAGKDLGGGFFYYSPTALKSAHDGFRVFSPTVPTASLTTAQTSIINYMNAVGETTPAGTGCWLRLWTGPVYMEFGGVTSGVDCATVAQRVIDKCIPTGLSVECDTPLTIGSQLTVPQYRTDPAVQLDFNHTRVHIRDLTSTAVAGTAVWVGSSVARVSIDFLKGPGADAGANKGVYITGQGGNIVDIGEVTGFQNGVEFNQSYANTLILGWCDDCIRGIALRSANENRIKGGRLGGRYSTFATDNKTCEIGIDIETDCNSNHLDLNIEYCRRSANSIGINDRGYATQFTGYIESCTAWNIYATGKNGRFEVLAGGTTLIADNAGFHAGDTNDIFLYTQLDFYSEVPTGGNTSLTFSPTQAFSVTGSGRIHGPSGLDTYPRATGTAVNQVLDNNLLGAASWSASAFGGASVAGTTAASATALPELGIYDSTQVTLPALASDSAEYVWSQGGINMAVGMVSFGVFGMCTSGSVDVYVRVVSSDGTIQHRSLCTLTSNSYSSFMRIAGTFLNTKADANATYQLRFRSSQGAQFYICGAHFVNRGNVLAPPSNDSTRRTILPGKEVDGTMFPNGMKLNGGLCAGYRKSSTTLTLNTSNMVYHTEVLSGGAAYNVLLGPGNDGQIITFKRDGVAGTVNILPSSTTIDGSTAAVNMTTAYSTVKLQYSAVDGWLKI